MIDATDKMETVKGKRDFPGEAESAAGLLYGDIRPVTTMSAAIASALHRLGVATSGSGGAGDMPVPGGDRAVGGSASQGSRGGFKVDTK